MCALVWKLLWKKTTPTQKKYLVRAGTFLTGAVSFLLVIAEFPKTLSDIPLYGRQFFVGGVAVATSATLLFLFLTVIAPHTHSAYPLFFLAIVGVSVAAFYLLSRVTADLSVTIRHSEPLSTTDRVVIDAPLQAVNFEVMFSPEPTSGIVLEKIVRRPAGPPLLPTDAVQINGTNFVITNFYHPKQVAVEGELSGAGRMQPRIVSNNGVIDILTEDELCTFRQEFIGFAVVLCLLFVALGFWLRF